MVRGGVDSPVDRHPTFRGLRVPVKTLVERSTLGFGLWRTALREEPLASMGLWAGAAGLARSWGCIAEQQGLWRRLRLDKFVAEAEGVLGWPGCRGRPRSLASWRRRHSCDNSDNSDLRS